MAVANPFRLAVEFVFDVPAKAAPARHGHGQYPPSGCRSSLQQPKLEHIPTMWTPVRRRKCDDQGTGIVVRSDPIGLEDAPGARRPPRQALPRGPAARSGASAIRSKALKAHASPLPYSRAPPLELHEKYLPLYNGTRWRQRAMLSSVRPRPDLAKNSHATLAQLSGKHMPAEFAWLQPVLIAAAVVFVLDLIGNMLSFSNRFVKLSSRPSSSPFSSAR